MLPNTTEPPLASCRAMAPRLLFHARRTATVAGSMSITRGLSVLVPPSVICRAAPCADDADRAADGDRARVQVDITPAQRKQLAAPHAGIGEHVPGRVHLAVVGRPVQEHAQLVSGPRVHLGAFACLAVGGLAFAAGLRSSNGTSSSTAAASAALRIVWMYRTVRADSGCPCARPSGPAALMSPARGTARSAAPRSDSPAAGADVGLNVQPDVLPVARSSCWPPAAARRATSPGTRPAAACSARPRCPCGP